jgi:hypothetical protein
VSGIGGFCVINQFYNPCGAAAEQKNDDTSSSQNVPSITRVAAGAFGFLTSIQVLDGPERYGAFSFCQLLVRKSNYHAKKEDAR